MMLYPTVSQLTNEKVNRYKLVIATAKGARHIIDKANEEREREEKHRLEVDRYGKEPRNEDDPLLNEKPVSIAVKKIYDGEYKILD